MNVAYIPVSGGSKSSIQKNLYLVNDKPLLYWTVKAACDCEVVDIVYVATDTEEIKEAIESFQLDKVQVINRKAENALDAVSVEAVMSELNLDRNIDNIVMMQVASPMTHRTDFEEKVKNIKILLTDCDGCLTDGGMYYSENGDELKKFNAKDGMGFRLLREHGIKIGIITGEDVDIVRRRAAKLKMDEVHCGIQDKLTVVKAICEKYGYTLDQVAYVGDDINDVEVLQSVGLACSIADAVPAAKEAADYVTQRCGGDGAIREIVDMILRCVEN